jgi:hypothetical protein
MGERDINDVLRNEGVGAARAMHDEARPFENEGAAILNDVRAFLSRFIAYPSEHAKIAHVLWVAHAHLMSAWESTPRIAFLSPAWIRKNARYGGHRTPGPQSCGGGERHAGLPVQESRQRGRAAYDLV